MKAITVRQPWAWAIMHAGKDVENRTRNIAGSYRGPLVIHAGLQHDFDADICALAPDAPGRRGRYRRNQWTYGAAVGVVDLADAHTASVIGGCGYLQHDCPEHGTCRHHCSEWAFGPNPAGGWFHHLVLANPRPFPRPIPYKGALGLWNFPDELLPDGWLP